MKRRQIAVCDREPEYTLRFAEYANQRKDPLFLVHGFRSCEALLEYIKEHPMDILLLAPEFIDKVLKKEQLGQIFLLQESDCEPKAYAYPAVQKLQSCPVILRQVLDTYAEQFPESMGQMLRLGRMKRIGVYSPVGRLGKTSFALALGKALAKQKRTLYLNLEEYSGFETLYPYGDGWTLSELMYFMKQGKKAFACKLEGMIQQMGGLDFIPPLKSPVELRHISLEDWECLLEALERESRYEIVILDLGGAVNGLYELLERCDGVYTPTGEDEIARAKLGQYENVLQLLEMDGILERTERFQIDTEEMEEFIQKEEKRWIEG